MYGEGFINLVSLAAEYNITLSGFLADASGTNYTDYTSVVYYPLQLSIPYSLINPLYR